MAEVHPVYIDFDNKIHVDVYQGTICKSDWHNKVLFIISNLSNIHFCDDNE